MEKRPNSNMHVKKPQLNTTFRIQGNYKNDKKKNIHTTKFNNAPSLNNNNTNINQPYIKKANNKNNQLEIINNQGRHNESANLNNNKMEKYILEKENIDILPVDCNGNKPSPRFGHSLVTINDIKICIFGGAVGDTKRISYSNETYIFNCLTKLWIKLDISNNKPLPKERAAHAAAVDENSVMMIYGGSTKNGGLAEDEVWLLYLNEVKEGEGEWVKYQTNTMISPGQRYGHSLNYMKPFFVLFGGNFTPNLTNEIWIININEKFGDWKKIIFKNDVGPTPRLYHTSIKCNYGKYEGSLIIFGGRDPNENALNDIWILTFNNTWSWTKGVVKTDDEIVPRYNHSMVLYDELMIVLGGRGHHSGNTLLPTEVYNIETGELFKFAGIPMNRHLSFIYQANIFLFGGFNSKIPNQSLGNLSRISLEKVFLKSPLITKIKKDLPNKSKINKLNNKSNNNQKNQKTQFKLSSDVIIGSGGILLDGEEDIPQDDQSLYHIVSIQNLSEENKRIGEMQNKSISSLIISKHTFNEKLIEKFLSTLLRPFDWYDDSKMDSIHSSLPFTTQEILELIKEVKPMLEKDHSLIRIRSPCKVFGNIHGVYDDLMRYFESFGNPSDDSQMGDINFMQYIFLGDFCDRGTYSLEVILLLFALKVKYPDFIYLIRGHHEDITINEKYGLGDECHDRLGDDISNDSGIFVNINKVFDYLPFGVLVDNNILLVHGGIGSSINTLDDIENIKRPIRVQHNVENTSQLNIIDLLWSEYSDEISNIEVNQERDKYKNGFIVKYGTKRLNTFLSENKINLLITAHQFVKEGFTTFNNDRLLTVFSATNYMDKYENIGGMITIAKKMANKRMNIIPKLININKGKKNSYRNNRSPSPIKKFL